MYPWRASMIQGLDRCALTVGTISGPHCHMVALLWCHFTSCGFTWSVNHSGKADQLTLASGKESYTNSEVESGGSEYA